MEQFSVGPHGERFALPKPEEYAGEASRIAQLAQAARERGLQVVVVLGVGFVGSVMAAVIADSEREDTGDPQYFVIGCQRPSPRSYWKIPLLNRGIPPVSSEDPQIPTLISRCVKERKSLVATYDSTCLRLADYVVVDIQCDYRKLELGDARSGEAEMSAFEAAMRSIGQNVSSDCLVLIETTVPPGTTEFVGYPIMKREFAKRGIESEPLLAHSFERVMPGREYVSSIRNFWRVCAGCNEESRKRVESFLNQVLNTTDYPLTIMDRPIESETTKIVENSYRATILAFMNEWSLFAERNGVDLIKVIDAIRMRPTHSNIMFPGPGIGGYCLPKDGALGYWAYKHILGFEDGDSFFRVTTQAIDINDTRGLHVAELTRDALRNMGRCIAGTPVLICGASYREDVGDTRYSGSEIVVRKLAEMGADIRVHDPYVEHWHEFENQDQYPASGLSLKRFFRNQEQLGNLSVSHDLKAAAHGAEALILAVRHKDYFDLEPDLVTQAAGGPIAIVDCFGILTDAKIRRYFELGCEVKAMGRGHVQRIKEMVRRRRSKDS